MAAGAPTSVAVEVEFTAGVWTDIATSVRGDSLEIKVGREPGGDAAQPGTLTFELDNADGTYTPDNPLSSLYPNLVEGKRIRIIVTKGSPSYRFLGWITVLEPDLAQSPNQSVTHVEAVDLLGMMARITELPDSLTGYVQGRGIGTAFWPLTDVNGAAGAVDVLGGFPSLTLRDVTPATGSLDWASDTSFGGGDAAYLKMSSGKGLWSASSILSLAAADAFCVNLVSSPDSSAFDEVFSLTAGRWAASRTRISIQTGVTDGVTYYWLNYYSLGVLSGQSASIPVAAGAWHYVCLYDYGDGTARLVVDDELGGSSEVTVSHSGHETYTHLSVGGAVAQSVGALGINEGTAGVLYPAYLVIGGALGTQLPTAVARIANLSALSADLQQYPSSAPYAYGSVLKTGGRNALEVAQQLANGYAGILYHAYSSAATQVVRVLRRSDARSATVALTLDAEADLAGPPVLLREIGRRAAIGVASNPVTSVTVTDATAPASVGSARVEVETFLRDTLELTSVATDAIARTRDQKLRVAQVTFDLWTASNDLYAAWFATEPGDRVRTGNLPSTYLGVTYIDGYVAGWTERPMVEGYPVTLDLDSAPYDEAVFDTARWGWGDGICTASSLTSSATSVTLTWTGSQTLSTSAGDYPMDIDINGERCTISSAPAGGTSPRTVTIVRGVAPTVARAHAAGEPVEVWDVGRWAF
jgi:hypothetical protein